LNPNPDNNGKVDSTGAKVTKAIKAFQDLNRLLTACGKRIKEDWSVFAEAPTAEDRPMLEPEKILRELYSEFRALYDLTKPNQPGERKKAIRSKRLRKRTF
jgi:hypothetical protein